MQTNISRANEAQPCLFAGWPSQRNQAGQCLSPSQIAGSKVSTASIRCPSGGVECNPTYFGKARNGNPLCVGGSGQAVTDYTQECLKRSPNTPALIKKYRSNEGFRDQNLGTLGREIGLYCSSGVQKLECQGDLKVVLENPGGFCFRGKEVTQDSMKSFTSGLGNVIAAVTGLSLAAIVGSSVLSNNKGKDKDKDKESKNESDSQATGDIPDSFQVRDDELDERGFARWDYLEEGEVEADPAGLNYQHDFEALPLREYNSEQRPADGGGVNSQLPQIGVGQDDRAREAGYYSYSPAERQWATERTTWRIQEAGKRLAEQGLIMAVGNISKQGGGELKPHSSHRNGVDIDLRLMGQNGRGYMGTYDSSEYSQENTFKMIQALIDTDPDNVRHIIVNDPQLVSRINSYYQQRTNSNRIISAICSNKREGNSRSAMHDNHIHFSWN